MSNRNLPSDHAINLYIHAEHAVLGCTVLLPPDPKAVIIVAGGLHPIPYADLGKVATALKNRGFAVVVGDL